MKTAQLKLISALVPYVAVLIGLYVLKNAWIAIGLYHFGITVFLITGDRNSLLKRVCTGWDSIIAVVGIVMSIMIFPIIFFFWGHMQLESISLKSALANFGLHGTSWFFFMIYFSTVQPFLEERSQIFFMDGFRICWISHSCFSMVYKSTLVGNSICCISYSGIHLEIYRI